MTFAICSSIEIDAPREAVWEVLHDVVRYPEWNPFTVSVLTTFELGSPVDMRVALLPPRKHQGRPRTIHQVEYVTDYLEGHRVSWGVAVGPSWFISADRVQELTDLGADRTRYFTSDVFTGFGVQLVRALTARYVQRGFDDVARALKARCELSA